MIESKVTETLKSRWHDVEDWLKVFNAVMRLQPHDVPVRATIEHTDAIRDIARRSSENLLKEMDGNYPPSLDD